MNSRTTPRFRELLRALPSEVRQQAREAYKLFASNPHHPSLRFKRLNVADGSMWSVRISRRYRAIGLVHGDTVTWDWIGSHAEYDRLLR